MPIVVRLEFLAQQDWCMAYTLLDDPGAFDNTGYELEDGVPPLICRLIISYQKPVEESAISPPESRRQ